MAKDFNIFGLPSDPFSGFDLNKRKKEKKTNTGATNNFLSSIKDFFTPKTKTTTQRDTTPLGEKIFGAGGLQTKNVGGFTIPTAPFDYATGKTTTSPTATKPTATPANGGYTPANFIGPIQQKKTEPTIANVVKDRAGTTSEVGATPPPAGPAMPSVTPTAPTSPFQSVIEERAGALTPRQQTEKRLAEAIAKISGFDPATRLRELRQEKGLGATDEQIGTFQEEILKTTDLLDKLEGDIKERTGEFLVTEGQRRRLLASEQAPLIKQISELTGALGLAEDKRTRIEENILQELGLEQEAATQPLELLGTELGFKQTIEEAFGKEQLSENEMSVLGLVKGGVTDPVEIYDALGGNVGINEIQQTLGAAGRAQLSPADQAKQDLEILKLTAGIELDQAQADKVRAEIGKIEAETAKSLGNISGSLRERILELPDATTRNSAFGGLGVMNNAKQIIDLLDAGVKTGPITGRRQSIQKSTPLQNEQFNQLTAAMTVFTANFIKSISGAQVSDKEREFLMNSLPDVNKQETANREGIKVITDLIRGDLELKLGVDFEDFPEIPRLDTGSTADLDQLLEDSIEE